MSPDFTTTTTTTTTEQQQEKAVHDNDLPNSTGMLSTPHLTILASDGTTEQPLSLSQTTMATPAVLQRRSVTLFGGLVENQNHHHHNNNVIVPDPHLQEAKRREAGLVDSEEEKEMELELEELEGEEAVVASTHFAKLNVVVTSDDDEMTIAKNLNDKKARKKGGSDNVGVCVAVVVVESESMCEDKEEETNPTLFANHNISMELLRGLEQQCFIAHDNKTNPTGRFAVLGAAAAVSKIIESSSVVVPIVKNKPRWSSDIPCTSCPTVGATLVWKSDPSQVRLLLQLHVAAAAAGAAAKQQVMDAAAPRTIRPEFGGTANKNESFVSPVVLMPISEHADESPFSNKAIAVAITTKLTKHHNAAEERNKNKKSDFECVFPATNNSDIAKSKEEWEGTPVFATIKTLTVFTNTFAVLHSPHEIVTAGVVSLLQQTAMTIPSHKQRPPEPVTPAADQSMDDTYLVHFATWAAAAMFTGEEKADTTTLSNKVVQDDKTDAVVVVASNTSVGEVANIDATTLKSQKESRAQSHLEFFKVNAVSPRASSQDAAEFTVAIDESAVDPSNVSESNATDAPLRESPRSVLEVGAAPLKPVCDNDCVTPVEEAAVENTNEESCLNISPESPIAGTQDGNVSGEPRILKNAPSNISSEKLLSTKKGESSLTPTRNLGDLFEKHAEGEKLVSGHSKRARAENVESIVVHIGDVEDMMEESTASESVRSPTTKDATATIKALTMKAATLQTLSPPKPARPSWATIASMPVEGTNQAATSTRRFKSKEDGPSATLLRKHEYEAQIKENLRVEKLLCDALGRSVVEKPKIKFEDGLLVLCSNQSANRNVVSNQLKVITILDGKSVKYQTQDGADPNNKEMRNELFAISGMRGKYPQLFRIAAGIPSFWGGFERFEEANDDGSLVKDFGGFLGEPLAATTFTKKLLTTVEKLNDAVASPSLSADDRKVSVLVSNQSCTLLAAKKTLVETLDGADDVNKDTTETSSLITRLGNSASEGGVSRTPASQSKITHSYDPNPPATGADSLHGLQDQSPGTQKSATDATVTNMASVSSARNVETDITVYGATGFTAKHVLTYLMQSSLNFDDDLKITLAGRNKQKLEMLCEEFTSRMENLKILNPNTESTAVFDVHVADSSDVDKLKSMATRSSVVINCAGPFAQYGEQVIAACAESGADYVDITGEVSWAGMMRRKYGGTAGKSGSRIISFSGFDSVPSDLAVFVAIQELKKATRHSSVEIQLATTWHSVFGGANGGTVKTAVETPLNLKANLLRWVPFLLDDPLILTHPSILLSDTIAKTQNRFALAEWLNQFISFDSVLRMGVSVPFFMAPINAKVVHASALALKYGSDFTYRERFLPAGFQFTCHLGTLALIPALIFQIGLFVTLLIMKTPFLGTFFIQMFYPPGSGPPDSVCKNGFAEVYAEVRTAPNSEGAVDKANCFLKFEGDPGNYVTAQCICESALCLLLDKEELPPRSEDGFGTPAELLGNVLFDRLKESDVRPLTFRTHVRKNVSKLEWRMYP